MSRSNKNFELKKDMLVQLALDLFIEKGYEQTTITGLQKAFNLTKGGLYHYFSSKEEILDAVIEYGLQQGVEEIKTHLNKISLEDRLMYLFFNDANNEFTLKLFGYKDNHKNSLVAYKLRDQSAKVLIPVLKDIILQYVDAGIYHCDFPEEMSEFCVILAKAVTDTSILPGDGISLRKKRIDGLIYLWKNCMNPPHKHLEQIRSNLYKVIEMQEGKE